MRHVKKTLGVLAAVPLALLVGCGDPGPEMEEQFEPTDQPDMEQQEGMGAPPDDGMGAPPPDDGMGAPPADDGMGAPPPDDGMGAPPPDDGMGAPPEGDMDMEAPEGDDQDR
ncbi:MAG: hypothetical protein EA372_07265 [Chromatiaceae bacterium]|nr:MAG: hypothetical protein EA372_07265 [Chromatiaceae bacterium]